MKYIIDFPRMKQKIAQKYSPGMDGSKVPLVLPGDKSPPKHSGGTSKEVNPKWLQGHSKSYRSGGKASSRNDMGNRKENY